MVKILTGSSDALEKDHTIFLLYEKQNTQIAFLIEKINTLREIEADKIEYLNFINEKNESCYVESIAKYSKDHLIQILDVNGIVKQNYKNEINE